MREQDTDESDYYYYNDDEEEEWKEDRFQFIPALHDEREELADTVSELVEEAYKKSLHLNYKSLFGPTLYIEGWLPPDPLYLDFWKGFDYIFCWFDQPGHMRNFSPNEISTVRYKLQKIWKYLQKEFQKLYEENRYEPYESAHYFADKGLLAFQLGNNLDGIKCIKKILNSEKVE